MTLKYILDAKLKDPAYLPKDGKTYCNLFVLSVCTAVGYPYFNGLMANDIVDFCEKNWIGIDAKDAYNNALLDNIVIAGQKADKHGHVAIIYPSRMEYSPSWDKDCPMIANVGKSNGIMRVSQAFHDEPDYFLMPTWGKRD